MQLLLHTDALVDAVARENDSLLALCRQGKVKGWVLTSSLQDAYKQIVESMGDKLARDTLGDALTHLSLLPLSGIDHLDCLGHSGQGFAEGLAILGVQQFRLNAVVTPHPEKFGSAPVQVLTPEKAVEQAKGPEDAVTGVPLLDIPATYHQWLGEAEHGMAEVVRSGRFILGQKVTDLEELGAEYCHSRFALGVSSGTDALLLALMAEGISDGDEVITSTFTFFATAGSIVRTGAKPVFVDIDPVTYNLDPKEVAAAITPRTRAIMPVHLYGQCADMDPILESARSQGIAVIEDAAQAIGAEYKGRRAGSLGDTGCFSFFPTKNLGGFGDGGLVTTQSEALHEKLNIMRVHGGHPKYHHKVIGGNFRLDALQAAVVAAKLPFLEGWTGKRRDNAARYSMLLDQAGLTRFLDIPRETTPRHVFNQYVVRIHGGRRDALVKHLAERGVGAEIYYPIPLHLQECFQSLGYKEGAFPHAEKAAKEVLALPNSFEVKPEQQDYVVKCLSEFFS